ncbi:MAG: 16S rRNA (cytidine(1402)-2'-O)-methyltransferase [Deinococcales bacterium]
MATIYLIPTPIGNLEDISLRALRLLKEVDAIAAEDTRHSLKLLSHYGIQKPLLRLDSHTMSLRAPQILAEYNTIAFISDAGSPGISDPGEDLVRIALARGDKVEALPGATAFVPALVLSGLACNRFTFEGFLPRKGSHRRQRLEAIVKSPVTVCLYESPQRIMSTLEDLAEHCGEDRQASLSREISKQYENHYRGA